LPPQLNLRFLTQKSPEIRRKCGYIAHFAVLKADSKKSVDLLTIFLQ
jgi:hypothetical protein